MAARDIVGELAELLYLSDSPAIPWDKALIEDRVLYQRTSELLLEAVVEYLREENETYDGALTLAVQLLSSGVELSQLRRTRAVYV